MAVAYVPIPRGDAGTLATVKHMKRYVRHGVLAPLTVELASLIVEGAGAYRPAQVLALRSWLQTSVRFMPDPRGPELLRSVPEMLDMIRRRGRIHVDCDEISVLGAALGKAVGFPARFVLLGFHRPGAPYRHVYSELWDGRRWVDLDITRPAVLPGVTRVMYVTV